MSETTLADAKRLLWDIGKAWPTVRGVLTTEIDDGYGNKVKLGHAWAMTLVGEDLEALTAKCQQYKTRKKEPPPQTMRLIETLRTQDAANDSPTANQNRLPTAERLRFELVKAGIVEARDMDDDDLKRAWRDYRTAAAER